MTSKFSNGRFLAAAIAAVLGTMLVSVHLHVPLQVQAQAPSGAPQRIALRSEASLTPVPAWEGEVEAVPAAPLVEGRTAPIEYQSRQASPSSASPSSASPNSASPSSASPNSASPNSASPNSASPNSASPSSATLSAERSQESNSRRPATAEAMSSLRQFMQDMLPERGVPPSVRQAAENGNEPRGASTGEPAARDGDRSQEKSILVQPADQRPRLDRASPPPAPTPPSQFDPPAVPERRQSDPAAAPRSTLAAPGAVTRPYLLSLPESGRSASAPPSVETAQYSKSQYSKSPYSNSQYSNSPGAPAIRPDDAPPQTWSTLSPSAYPSSYPLSSSPTPAAPSYAYSAPSYAYSAPSYSTPSPPPSLPAAPASRSPIALPGDRYVSPSPPAAAANYYTPSVYTPVGTTPPVGSTPQWPASYAPTTSYPPTNSYAPTNSYGARETVLQPAALDPADLRPALPSPAYPYGGSYSSNSSNVRLAPVTSACNVAPTSPAYLPGAPPYEVKRGLFNQLIVRVPGQPLRNFFRFVTP